MAKAVEGGWTLGFLDQDRPVAAGNGCADAARRGEIKVPLDLRHAGCCDPVVRFEIHGAERAPTVIVAGGISADRHVIGSAQFPDQGWWQSQAGSFDLQSFQLLAIDWLGADGTIDAPIDPADQARAIAAVLDDLGIERAAGFVGASYGGMVGMHFAALFPQRIGRLVTLCASDRPHPFSSALRALQRRAVTLVEGGANVASGVALARALAILTYRTPAEFALRFDGEPTVADGVVRTAAEDYLDVQGGRLAGRMSATAYRRLSESIDLHRVDPGAIACPVTLIAADSDQLVPIADVERLSGALSSASLHVITSLFGHDSFLKEAAQIDAILSPILSNLEEQP